MNVLKYRRCASIIFALVSLLVITPVDAKQKSLRKVEDIVIYEDVRFHSAFPSIVRRPDGELLVAFRRAPDRRQFGDKNYTHTDPNSYLYLTRSRDQGKSWSDPKMFFADPFGGSQDPCLLQLRDRSLLCATYGWALMNTNNVAQMKKPVMVGSHGFVFMGGSLIRSEDGGNSWGKQFFPAPTPIDNRLNIFGKPLPSYNRGAMCEGKDGRLFWVVASNDGKSKPTSTHLMISEDKGLTWNYSCPVASDEKITFNETSIYETPKGDLVAFIRAERNGGVSVFARSIDNGKSFQPWQSTGFVGLPFHAMRLPDDRVLLTYGHRAKPFGIRARILDAECTNVITAPEIVLREDGGDHDIGYTWSSMISKDRVLVTYYFNIKNGTRHIAGTILELE